MKAEKIYQDLNGVWQVKCSNGNTYKVPSNIVLILKDLQSQLQKERIINLSYLEQMNELMEFPKEKYLKRIERYDKLTIQGAKPSYHFLNGAKWMFEFQTSNK